MGECTEGSAAEDLWGMEADIDGDDWGRWIGKETGGKKGGDLKRSWEKRLKSSGGGGVS